MPELPEVETTKNAILPFQGKTLKRIIVNNPSLRWPIDEKAINKIAADEIKPNRPRLDESKIKKEVTRTTFKREENKE